MVKIRNFHEDIEKNLARLGNQIETEKSRFESKDLSEKELVKKSIQSLASEAAGENIAPAATPKEDSALPSYLQGEGADKGAKLEVEQLLKIAFRDGLDKALKEAARHSAFVEDAFHDALVDKLLPELQKRGMIK